MTDYEHAEEVCCPHCDLAQDDEMLPYKIADDFATGACRYDVTCDQCKKEFHVEQVKLTRYNVWANRQEFYR